MRKSNKILIILIIIFLILIAGAVSIFAYTYFATDLLKTEKELFFKYLSQISNEENQFIDASIEKYFNKKKQNSFENAGTFNIDVTFPEDTIQNINENIIKKVNDLEIRFSGMTNPTERQAQQNVEIDYGNDVIFPINYRRDREMFGLQSKFVGSRYIAIENNNLKDFAAKLGVDTGKIPDKIELKQDVEQLKFTSEEIAQIKERYGIVFEEITEDKFTSSKTQIGTKYILTLTKEDVTEVLSKLLEILKQDTMLINKLNQYVNNVGEYISDIKTEDIQNIINEISIEDFSEIEELKITIGQNNKELNQILIECNKWKLEIIKNKMNESLSYVINVQADVESEKTALDDNSFQNTSKQEVNIRLILQYTGLEALQNVKEVYECSFRINMDDQKLEYKYNFENNVQFKDSTNIDYLNENTALILNNCDSLTLTTLMNSISERLVTVNRDLMEELGLKESENPLLYSNPITMSALSIYNIANDAINNNISSLVETEKQMYNEKFEKFKGEQRGTMVNSMIRMIINHNLAQEDDTYIVQVKLDGVEILRINEYTSLKEAESEKIYIVEPEYDISTGLIKLINITSQN